MAPDEQAAGSAQVALTEDERSLLLKACKHFRSTIPVYLRSRERELASIDDLIRRLSSPAASE